MLLSHGGTIFISNLNRYSEAAQRLIRGIGIDVSRYSEFVDPDLYSSLGLRRSVFFDRETFGTDRLLVGEGEPSWRDFLARAPLSEAAREDIVRLHESNIDYLPHLSLGEKVEYLQRTSYEDFLLKVVKISPEAISFLETSNYPAIGLDGISAWTGGGGRLGTTGLGLGNNDDGAETIEERAFFQFPDGNASIARLLVRSLIPDVAPDSTMEDIVAARFDYDQLDRKTRLSACVWRVRR